MIKSVSLTTAQKTVMGQKSNILKNKMKRGNYIVKKLLGQFIEVHGTQFFKRL